MADKTYQTTLLIRGDSKNAVREVKLTRDELEKLTGVQNRNTGITGKFSKAWNAADRSVQGATRALSGLPAVIGALGLGKMISETISATNEYASLQGQLRLVTDSQDELNAVYDRSLALSNETGQATESTVNLYARLARSTEQLRLSEEQLFTITEAINKSFVVSGSSATEASSAILQLSQGMASGVLRGEELNSVLENSPRLARAIADGLGVTIGQLREMGAEGELTAAKVSQALLSTAHEIEAEFEGMPVTISRVWQGLSNDLNDALGQVDTSELIGSIDELHEVIGDPEFKEAITSVAGGLLNIVTAGAKATTKLVALGDFLGEELAAKIHGVASDDIPRLEDELAGIEKRLNSSLWVWAATDEKVAELRTRAKELRSEIAVARKALNRFGKTGEKTAEETEKATNAVREMAQVLPDVDKRLQKANKEFESGHDILDKMTRDTEQYIDTLQFEIDVLGMSERQQFIANQVRQAGTTITAAQREEIQRLAGVLYDEQEAQRQATETAKEAAKAMDPFAEAVEHAAERIDSAFADAWKGAFDSFEDFSDGLLDAFKQLMAELAHAAITRPIVMQLAAGLGGGAGVALGGGAGSTANTVQSATSLYSMLSGGVAGIGNGLLSGATNVIGMLPQSWQGIASGALGNIGQFGFDALSSLGINGAGAGTSLLAGAGLSAGAGALGGWAGTALGENLFGKDAGSSWGAAAGTAIGTVILPGIGSAIGGAIGGLADALFGTGSSAPKTARDLNFATGKWTNRSYTSGSEMNDAADQITNSLFAFADAIGGSNAQFGIAAHSKDGVFFVNEGRTYGDDIERFMLDAMKRIVAGAEDLSPVVKSLAEQFEGAAGDMADFTLAMQSTRDLIQNNPVEQAVSDFAMAQEMAGNSLYDTYQRQLDAIRDLSVGFDGSASSATELNAALGQNQSLAYQLALNIQQMNEELSSMFADSAQAIRESVMSEDELFEMRKRERDELRASLGSILDPDQLAATLTDINQLNTALFQSIDDPSEARAEVFARYAERTAEAGERQMARILNNLEQSQATQNQQLNQMMQSAVQKQQQAADTILSAAEIIAQAASSFQTFGQEQVV